MMMIFFEKYYNLVWFDDVCNYWQLVPNHIHVKEDVFVVVIVEHWSH
jgi:hypothetical protein